MSFPGDDSLVSRLVGTFFRFVRTPWHTVPAPGLSRAETGILLTIHHTRRKGKACRVSSLSRMMHVSSPTITQHIANLERRGLVRKEPDAKDKRAMNLALTDQGLQMLAAHRDAMDRNIQELIDCLGEKEAERLVVLMTKTSDFFAEKQKEYDEDNFF